MYFLQRRPFYSMAQFFKVWIELSSEQMLLDQLEPASPELLSKSKVE